MEYYVFDDEQTAINAELYISTVGGCPRIGRRASDGELQPDKQTTIKWAEIKQRLDGKWVFPRVSLEMRIQFPEEVFNDFNINYPHTIENYDKNWFPQEEG